MPWSPPAHYLAQVFLPVAVHAEQEGTFISSDGVLGLLPQALPANGVRPDWQIISQLGAKMGFAMKSVSPKAIFKELATKMPLWAGLEPKFSAPCPRIKAAVSGKFVPFETDISLPGRRPINPHTSPFVSPPSLPQPAAGAAPRDPWNQGNAHRSSR